MGAPPQAPQTVHKAARKKTDQFLLHFTTCIKKIMMLKLADKTDLWGHF